MTGHSRASTTHLDRGREAVRADSSGYRSFPMPHSGRHPAILDSALNHGFSVVLVWRGSQLPMLRTQAISIARVSRISFLPRNEPTMGILPTRRCPRHLEPARCVAARLDYEALDAAI